MFCSRCGTKFKSDQDLFCSMCGAQRTIVKLPNEVNVHNQEAKPQVQPSNIEQTNPQFHQSVTQQVNPQANEIITEQVKPQFQQVVEQQENPQVQEMATEQVKPQFEPVTEQQVNPQAHEIITEQVKPQFEQSVTQQPVIPVGFVLDPASGWYYKSKAKQISNGSYVNEITWFDPKSGRTAVKDYPMTQQQIQAMLIQYRNNQKNQATGENANAIGQPVPTPKKSKKGLVIGGVIVIILLILGFCTWQFKWYEIFTGKGDDIGVVDVDPTIEPTSEPTPMPTATLEPTLIPESPLGVLNEDYILIGNQEFLTSDTALFLESMNLSNSDLESLKYMKNLDSLYLYDNNLTDMTYINDISTLTYLDVSKNDIYHINDIAMLTNLQSLYLDDTKVSDLAPLSSMEQLACLSIKNSEVFDLEPIVGIDSLMYLYVEGSLVDDFTYLDLMPNLYFCDSYITGGSTELTPEPTIEPSEGYTFTDDDNLYLQPITDNYVVATLVPNSYEQIALVSFDENDTVVQMKLRMEVGYDLTEMDKETYLGYFKDTLGVDEITIAGSVIYVDYPEDDLDTYNREGFISDLELEGCEIIVDVKN